MPTAGPATAAISGLGKPAISRRKRNTGASICEGGWFKKSAMSLPAENTWGWPCSTTTRTAASAAAAWSRSASEPVQVNVSARRAWSLRIDTGTTLELGRNDLENRLARFVQNYERAAQYLGRRVDYVDLRYRNGFAVRVPELARAEAKEKRK